MTPRDLELLAHIARHRLTIRAVLEETLFETRAAMENVLKRLLGSGRKKGAPLIRRAKLPGNLSHYQLTEEGARAIGLPRVPAALDEVRIHQSLAVLWYSLMGEKRRLLLTGAEIEEALGNSVKGDPQIVLEPEGGWSRLEEVYVPAAETQAVSVLKRLEKRIHARRKDEVSCEWLSSRALSFVVLVDREDRREKIKKLVCDSALERFTKVAVELAPSPLTLKSFVDERAVSL